MDHREFLLGLFDAAVSAARAPGLLTRALPASRGRPARVIGAGKAAAAMAAVLDRCWDGPLEGVVVTPYGHGLAAGRIEVLEAAHPLPDAAALAAGQRMLGIAQAAQAGELVICLLSGGASALLCVPPPGITLAMKAGLGRQLLASGADIAAINTVRRHLSLVKGGRLAAAAFPADLLCLAVSDVPGDDPAVIGSGPTVADPTTRADAAAVLRRWRIEAPAALWRWLENPAAESVKPGDPRLGRAQFRLVATPATALAAAARRARALGVRPVLLGSALAGEARALGRAHAALALAHARRGGRCVLLSGGETTVTVRGPGRGGRNTEYLLALFEALAGAPGIAALAADTDGIDGSADSAGAFFDAAARVEAAARGLAPGPFLAANDSHAFFATLGTVLHTGPTRTNVNDFRAILVDAVPR